MSKHFPDLYYEQYLLGELPKAKAEELEQTHDFAERISRLEQSNKEILDSYSPAAMARRIENQGNAEIPGRAVVPDTRSARPFQRILTVGLPSLAALAFVIVFGLQNFGPDRARTGQESEIVRLKGAEASLSLYLLQDQEVVELSPGAEVSSGNRIQVAYNAAGARHGAVYSLDGNGVVTTHFPFPPTASTLLEQGGEQTLPRSFTLDDAPQFERFYFVTSEESFDVRSVAEAIETQATAIVDIPATSLALGDRFLIIEFTVWKGN